MSAFGEAPPSGGAGRGAQTSAFGEVAVSTATGRGVAAMTAITTHLASNGGHEGHNSHNDPSSP